MNRPHSRAGGLGAIPGWGCAEQSAPLVYPCMHFSGSSISLGVLGNGHFQGVNITVGPHLCQHLRRPTLKSLSIDAYVHFIFSRSHLSTHHWEPVPYAILSAPSLPPAWNSLSASYLPHFCPSLGPRGPTKAGMCPLSLCPPLPPEDCVLDE